MVVDDREALGRALEDLGAKILSGGGLDFRDRWSNRWQVVQYSDVQIAEAPGVLRGMGLGHLEKTGDAPQLLRKNGLTQG